MRKFIFAALMLPALAHSAVYKCTGADGKVGFSDKPCSWAESVEAIDVIDNHIGGQFAEPGRINPAPAQRSVQTQTVEPEARSNGVCREFSRAQVRMLIIRNQVVKGMRVSDAVRAWGRPHGVNGGWQ